VSGNSKAVLYSLECGHAAPGPTTLVNGKLRCAWHGDEYSIVGVIEYEWHADCRNCTFSRWAGLSKHNATIFASGHTRHSPAHTAVVEYARNPEAVRTAAKFAKWQGMKTG
jgi:hypothetical protein